MKNLRVYIASPYTHGDHAANVRRSINEWDSLASLGYYPYCPLLNHFVDMIHPRSYEDWLDHAMSWLRTCDAVRRLTGFSMGVEREVKLAKTLDIPVFYTRKDLCKWAQTQ